jgi:hypothetical protein
LSEQQETRFQPGRSGNPGGRPPGSRNRATLAREEALQERAQAYAERMAERAEEIGELTYQRALAGSLPAARLLFQTLLARRPVAVDLPDVDGGMAAVIAAGSALIQAMAAGEISPADGIAMQRALLNQARLLKVAGPRAVATAPREAAAEPIPARAVTGEKQENTGCRSPTTFLPPAFLPMTEWLEVSGMGEKLKAMRPHPLDAPLPMVA